MRQDDPTTLTNRIIRACNVPQGLSMAETIAATGGHPPSVNATIPLLVRRGLLHRVGTRMLMRYFAQAEHAQAYVAVFAQDRAAAKEAKNKRRAAYYAAKRKAAGHAVRARKPRPKAEPKPRKAKQARHCHGPAPTVKPRKAKAATAVESVAHATTVTWPEHVQVQRTSTPVDDRYTFTPPPGWVGEFGRDWERKRSGRTS